MKAASPPVNESVPVSEAVSALLEIRKFASGSYHPAFALAHIFDVATRASRGDYTHPAPTLSVPSVEEIARIIALLLPNAIDDQFNGKVCASRFPEDFGAGEQAAFRLVATNILSALTRDKQGGAEETPTRKQSS